MSFLLYNKYCTTEPDVKTSKKSLNQVNPPGVEWISFPSNNTVRENSILNKMKSKNLMVAFIPFYHMPGQTKYDSAVGQSAIL